MANPTKDSSEKVSLEELLRFKRAERPDNQFWDQFDAELHQKMMRALVKKDPWPIQLLRGLSGRLVQTTAITAAAALLALTVVRPALVSTDSLEQPVLAAASVDEPIISEVPGHQDLDGTLLAEADYRIDVLTASTADFSQSVTSDYGLDHIDVASYDSTVYSSGMALTGVTSTGLASLVY